MGSSIHAHGLSLRKADLDGNYFLRPGFIHFGSLNLRSLLAELVRVEAERVLLDDGSSDAEACLDSDGVVAVIWVAGMSSCCAVRPSGLPASSENMAGPRAAPLG